jgi:ATP-dependent Clp protease ATP-binding subunit ClpA
VIQQRIENPLAQRILGGSFLEGDVIHVDADTAKHEFSFQNGRSMTQAAEVA